MNQQEIRTYIDQQFNREYIHVMCDIITKNADYEVYITIASSLVSLDGDIKSFSINGRTMISTFRDMDSGELELKALCSYMARKLGILMVIGKVGL